MVLVFGVLKINVTRMHLLLETDPLVWLQPRNKTLAMCSVLLASLYREEVVWLGSHLVGKAGVSRSTFCQQDC